MNNKRVRENAIVEMAASIITERRAKQIRMNSKKLHESRRPVRRVRESAADDKAFYDKMIEYSEKRRNVEIVEDKSKEELDPNKIYIDLADLKRFANFMFVSEDYQVDVLNALNELLDWDILYGVSCEESLYVYGEVYRNDVYEVDSMLAGLCKAPFDEDDLEMIKEAIAEAKTIDEFTEAVKLENYHDELGYEYGDWQDSEDGRYAYTLEDL